MTLLDLLDAARQALQAVAPTFIRDAVPLKDGQPVLPDRCIVLDLITDSKQPDFTDVYSVVRLQVGCWAPTIAQALEDLEAARIALESSAPAWEVVRVNGTQTDEHGIRGVTADFTAVY